MNIFNLKFLIFYVIWILIFLVKFYTIIDFKDNAILFLDQIINSRYLTLKLNIYLVKCIFTTLNLW